jgi:hypothetical protein
MLDVVTGGVLDGKRAQRDDEWGDIFTDLQGDSRHAIADIGGVTNESPLFTGDHLDPVPDLDRSLSILIPYRAEKRKVRMYFVKMNGPMSRGGSAMTTLAGGRYLMTRPDLYLSLFNQ